MHAVTLKDGQEIFSRVASWGEEAGFASLPLDVLLGVLSSLRDFDDCAAVALAHPRLGLGDHR